MNIKNMKRLVEAMTDPENSIEFDMRFYINNQKAVFCDRTEVLSILKSPCGTAACIGGMAAIIAWTEDGVQTQDLIKTATEWLGLDNGEARYLFMGHWFPHPLSSIKKYQAVQYLKNLIEWAEAKEVVA